jgi:uncharacterized protein (DUF433 family)
MVTTRPRSRVIVRNPGIHGGEPIVRGTRVPVRSIVIELERYDGDVERVARGYTISPDEVRAALAYYGAHKAEIDRIIEQRERDAMA